MTAGVAVQRAWRGALAVVAAVVIVAATGATAGAAPRQEASLPVAHVQTSATRLRPGMPLHVDLRLSRMPRGDRLDRAFVSFGDGSGRVPVRHLVVLTHRYRRAGRYAVVFVLRDERGRRGVARSTVTVGSQLVVAAPKAGTVVASDAEVATLLGPPSGTQIVTVTGLASRVGAAFVLPASSVHPDGVLGIVERDQPLSGGGGRLWLRPATLDEAYANLKIDAGGSLADPGVSITGGAAGDRLVRAHAANAATFHLGGTGFRCSDPSAAPAISADLDLSALHWQLDFQPLVPEIHFLVTGSPTLKLGIGLNAGASCHWTLPLHAVIPIPGTPLVVKISPILVVSANGTLSATWSWSPRLTYGFDRGAAVNADARVFNPGAVSFDFNANADADVFLGLRAELSLAGRVGVGADLGPDFTIGLDQTPAQSCLKRSVGLKIDATATADVFVKNWTFGLGSITLAGYHWQDICNNNSGGTGGSSGGSGSGGSGGGAGGGSGGSGGGTGGTPSCHCVTPMGPTSGPAGFGLQVTLSSTACSDLAVLFDGAGGYSEAPTAGPGGPTTDQVTTYWGSNPIAVGKHQVSFQCWHGGAVQWTDPGFAITVTAPPMRTTLDSTTVPSGGSVTFTSGTSGGPSPCPLVGGVVANYLSLDLFSDGNPFAQRGVPLPDNSTNELLSVPPGATPGGNYTAAETCAYTTYADPTWLGLFHYLPQQVTVS